MFLQIYRNESCTATTYVFAELKDKNYLTISLYISSPEGEEEFVGESGIRLESHNSYTALMDLDHEYIVRDIDNNVKYSHIKLIQTNRITMGSRMKYDELENRYGGVSVLQINTNNISFDHNIFEAQINLFKVQRKNFHLEGDFERADDIDELTFTPKELFKTGSKRHSFWDFYGLEIDGVELHFDEKGRNLLKSSNIINMNNREYVDVIIKKFAPNYRTQLTRECDNELVSVEASAGFANAQRVRLKNGIGKFRWYNFGYTGELNIKLGWRWYSGVNEFKLVVE